MADFLSSYTGQQIDQKLADIDKKLNVTDIVDVVNVGDDQTPASSRLMKEAYTRLDEIDLFNQNKILRIDGLTQSVKGKKTFEAEATFQNNIVLPSGSFVNLTSRATEANHAINLAMLRDHGLSVQDSAGVGIAITTLTTGYLKLGIDFSTIPIAPTGTIIESVMVSSGVNSYSIPYEAFLDSAVTSVAFNKKLDKAVYDVKMSELDTALTQRVLVSTYNLDIAALNVAIGNRVLTSTYNVKMASLDSALAGKVETTTYNTAITSLNSGKVDVTTYNAKMTSLDNAISAKMDYAKTGTFNVSSNATVNMGTFPKPLGMKILVACTFNADGLTNLYDVHVSGSSISSGMVLQGNSNVVNFLASSSGSNVIISVNSNNAMKVDYKILANFT